MKHFYIDTSIWMDLYEDRKGFDGEPLGDYAFKLFDWIRISGHRIVVSDVVLKELEKRCSIPEIRGLFKIFESIIEKVFASKVERREAGRIAEERDLPHLDVLHAILARDNGFVLITRDNHFKRLVDIAEFYKPEDLV